MKALESLKATSTGKHNSYTPWQRTQISRYAAEQKLESSGKISINEWCLHSLINAVIMNMHGPHLCISMIFSHDQHQPYSLKEIKATYLQYFPIHQTFIVHLVHIPYLSVLKPGSYTRKCSNICRVVQQNEWNKCLGPF